MKDLLVILKTSPYRTPLSKLALDLAMTFATFDQKVSILIVGDGCFQLHPNQNTEHSHYRNHLKTLKSLGDFYDESVLYFDLDGVESNHLQLLEC